MDGFPALVRERVYALYGDRLVELVLFGSRARGDHRPGSDWDFAVRLRPLLDRSRDEEALARLPLEIFESTGEWVQFVVQEAGNERPGLLRAAIRMEGRTV
ncbi:MAG: hypothetical protein OHK0024_12860 [Thalassobaculales bacterium]